MRSSDKSLLAGFLMGMFLVASCGDKEVFDEKVYDKILDIESPIDSIENNHNWDLTTNIVVTITANAGAGVQKAYVMVDNPLESRDVELLTQCDIRNGQSKPVIINIPSRLDSLYAALYDDQGRYTITRFGSNQIQVGFTDALATNQNLSLQFKPITYTYCFEEEQPLPGDYDYNDVVIRVSQEAQSDSVLTLHVELAAVGASDQMACGIRLVGVRHQDVDSVVVRGNKTFNDGYPSHRYQFFSDGGLLQKGRNNEAVINLFEDAHWATGDNLNIINGIFSRKHYNVSRGSSEDYQIIMTRSFTYDVYFNRHNILNDFTMALLDPFVIKEVNGGKWETHTYAFRSAQTMYEYKQSEGKHLPWALQIPFGTFRYPLDGVNMGFAFYVDGVEVQMDAAYVVAGHSFADWARNHKTSLDWYLTEYASSPELVYY